jgi:hypothetical protein
MPVDAPQPRDRNQAVKSGRKPLPADGVGATSATRFLHVKRFRFTRVRGMLGIAAIVLVVGFVAVCLVVYAMN